jgi:DNA repair exonuclease SbcCD ATPase subunit
MQFLKPKKYDPGAAQRLAEEAAAREATARETRAAEKARRRALKEELGLAPAKPGSGPDTTNSDTNSAGMGGGGGGGGGGTGRGGGTGDGGSDYSAPSASDTSDSDDGDAYGPGSSEEQGGDGDDDITALLGRMRLKGESMCPMRQYELLQRRYVRSVQELKHFGDREREHEQLMSELKIMGKRQRTIIMRTAEQNMDAKDKFIADVIERLRALSSPSKVVAEDADKADDAEKEETADLADLADLAKSLDTEFQNLSASMTRFSQQCHHHDASTSAFSSAGDHDIDIVRIELSKVKACSLSLETENDELRAALTDLGNKDPERLVVVRQQLEDAESRLKEVEQHLEEALLEKEAAEEDAGIARGAERAAKSRTEALSGHAKTTAVDSRGAGRKSASASVGPVVVRASTSSTSSERKLAKDVRHLKSKVKKLEASKLALMSILKDAQAELAKRSKDPSVTSSVKSSAASAAAAANTSSSEATPEQAEALKKKDKKIQKLKTQVKELTSILRDLEEARKTSKLTAVSEKSEDAERKRAEDAKTTRQKTVEAERSNAKVTALQTELDMLLAARAASSSEIAEIKALAEEEKKQLSESCEKLRGELEIAVKAAGERAENHSRLCDDLRRQLSKTKRDAATEERRLKASVRSLQQQTSSLGAKVVVFGKYVRDAETGMRAELRRMQSVVKAELQTIPTIVAQAQGEITEKLNKQLSAFEGLAEKYKREYRERKRLFNLVQELRGNIRVFCRVRPISSTEESDGRHNVVTFPQDESDELLVDMGNGRKKRFTFDKVLKPGCTNSDVFAGVADLCMSVLDGYNVCIFA